MRDQHRSTGRRSGRLLAVTLISVGLIAGACSKKDDSSSDGTTKPSGTTGDTTAATTPGDTTPPDTTPQLKPVSGGSLVVSGEAEVTNPWTPAAMQCDSYCQQRARAFFDPIAAVGDDNKVHPYLADTITPNADFTEWTITVRPGITFTDGTPVNADALIRNLQETGNGLLVGKALVDVAKEPDPGGAVNPDGTPKIGFKITKADDMTFTIYTGKNGDPASPLSWPGFDSYLTGQWGLIASPTWLDAVAADPSLSVQPVGSGPFIVESYAPRDALVVKRNPGYWQKDADGVQLPYLDQITFKVIEDGQTAQQALESGNIDIFSDSNANVLKALRDEAADFPMAEQTDFVETNYLLIDLAKPGPTSDARVRCALSKAIDRQELIDLTGGGILEIANGVFSPGQEGYLEDNGFDPAQDIEGAKALIDEYKAETGATSVAVTYGHTADRTGDQVADLLKGYWAEIGVDTKVDVVPQDQFITNALFGVETFFIYGWRQHAGVYVDAQNFWWNSASGTTDGPLSLNFARINDPIVDENLAIARSDPDEANRKAAAEAINVQMAKECYQIPTSYTLWGTAHNTSVMGLGETTLPDGSLARDGAGFSGQFWLNNIWINPDA